MVAFEAAVAGGIPIIKALREGLTANRIEWIAGIINGTTNFILSEMRDKGLPFDAVLKEAQRLGYAEADPDLRHRGHRRGAQAHHHDAPSPSASRCSSTKALHRRHLAADQGGHRLRRAASATASSCSASPSARRSGIELRVHPTLIPARRLIANVEGVMNAVLVQGDAVGATLYYGRGAGAEPTASAVVADLVDVTRMHTADPEHRVPHLAFQPDQITDLPILPIERGGDLLLPAPARLRPARACWPTSRASWPTVGISIDAMLQKEPAEGEEQVDIIMLTHRAIEKNVNAALERIEAAADHLGQGDAHTPGRAGCALEPG
ncbi:MAG: hypothetical protein MZW92_67805 [Comamonadaceae bacterium]|nr:hypothetical protein [Comamonadaceae bacterium]